MVGQLKKLKNLYILVLQWVESCDCLLRLDGESKGADIEVSRAKELKIPVFYSIDELKIFYS